MKEIVTVVDYGMGNIRSVCRALGLGGVSTAISSDPDVIANAQRLILPGVGHFARAMSSLRSRGLIDALNDAVIQRKVPVLGICLGMQLMAQSSSEGDQEGLGWLDGSVVRFDVRDELLHKVPHMGWNQAKRMKESALLNEIAPFSEFYFLHSFHYVTKTHSEILMKTSYSYDFVSAIAKGNISGVQFHPEKSHEAGAQLLENFARA